MHPLIGFISDAHGNSQAFERGIALLLEQGVERIYFLGDAIGYVPSAEVLDSLRRLGGQVLCIRGNHEAMLLEGQISTARERVYQLQVLRPSLTQQQIDMIMGWPSYRRISINGLRLLLVHGSPADHTFGYVYPDTELSSFEPDADWVFMGNTHYPFIREEAGTHYVNVGSCGLPRDDGRYGSVALLDTFLGAVRILRFDITAECAHVLTRFPSVHSSVREIYERRRAVLTGEIL